MNYEEQLKQWIERQGERAAAKYGAAATNWYVGRYRAWWQKACDAMLAKIEREAELLQVSASVHRAWMHGWLSLTADAREYYENPHKEGTELHKAWNDGQGAAFDEYHGAAYEAAMDKRHGRETTH